MNQGTLLALSAIVAMTAAACAKTPPRVPVVSDLAIPTPPARVLIPVELPEYVAPEPAPPVAEAPPPTPPRNTANRSTEKPASAPPAAPVAATPPPVLQTTNNPGAAEQRIGQLLGSAEQRLKTVNPRDLGALGRAHYDQARSYIRMANEALRIRNYMFAEELATKANTVAGLLGKS